MTDDLQFQQLLAQLPIAVAVLADPGEPVLYANPATHSLFMVPDGQPIQPARVLPEFNLEQSRRRVSAALAEGSHSWQRSIRGPDGSLLEARFTALAGRGPLDGLVIILITDETVSAQREQALRRMFEDLANTAADPSGDAVLGAMVQGLATVIGAEGCFVARLHPDGHAAELAAHWQAGALQPGMDYSLRDTACEDTQVDGQHLRPAGEHGNLSPVPGVVPAGNAYAGVRLSDPRGHSLGHLAVYARRLPDSDNLLDTLRTYAPLAAMELNRQRMEGQQAELLRQVEEHRHLEVVNRITGGIAHDFNNLLATISGNAELVQMDVPDNASAQARLAALLGAADKAARLCQLLLSHAGGALLQRRTENLSVLLRDAAAQLREGLGDDTQLELQLSDHLPDLQLDRDQVLLGVENLVRNAAEAGARRIRLTTRRDGGYVELEVGDDGEGMSGPSIRHAVEPFWSTRGTGRGLGLPAAVGIVKAHGGQLGIDSRPGHGTRVQLSFRI